MVAMNASQSTEAFAQRRDKYIRQESSGDSMAAHRMESLLVEMTRVLGDNHPEVIRTEYLLAENVAPCSYAWFLPSVEGPGVEPPVERDSLARWRLLQSLWVIRLVVRAAPPGEAVEDRDELINYYRFALTSRASLEPASGLPEGAEEALVAAIRDLLTGGDERTVRSHLPTDAPRWALITMESLLDDLADRLRALLINRLRATAPPSDGSPRCPACGWPMRPSVGCLAPGIQWCDGCGDRDQGSSSDCTWAEGP